MTGDIATNQRCPSVELSDKPTRAEPTMGELRVKPTVSVAPHLGMSGFSATGNPLTSRHRLPS